MNAIPAPGESSMPDAGALARAAALAGLDLKAVGEANLRRAVQRAMSRLDIGASGYLDLLTRDPAERRLLAGEAVVQESWLFRDPDAYAVLARMARELPGDARPVRILSVPCAAGEEPASIAVSLLQAGFSPEDFQVDAVDASPGALAQARTGRFPLSSVRGESVPPLPYFRPISPESPVSPVSGNAGDTGGYMLDQAALSRIRFLEGDVLDESFLPGQPPYQAIFCRHLLIYLAPEARLRLASTLVRLLAPGGMIFSTPAEAPAFQELGLRIAPRRFADNGAAPARPREKFACEDARPHTPQPQRPAEPAPPGEATTLAFDLAKPLADAGRLDEALAVIERGLETEGPSARLYHLKGAVLLALGREPEAEAALRRAVYLEPGHLEALTHLEHLSRARGHTGEAERLSRRAGRTERATKNSLARTERP